MVHIIARNIIFSNSARGEGIWTVQQMKSLARLLEPSMCIFCIIEPLAFLQDWPFCLSSTWKFLQSKVQSRILIWMQVHQCSGFSMFSVECPLSLFSSVPSRANNVDSGECTLPTNDYGKHTNIKLNPLHLLAAKKKSRNQYRSDFESRHTLDDDDSTMSR